MFQFSSMGSLALVAVAMCLALAVLLFRVGTPGSVSRKLAVLLLIEALTLVSTGYLDSFLVDSVTSHSSYATWTLIEAIVHTFGDCAMLALYPTFLAAALPSKLTLPFARKDIQIVIALASIAMFFTTLMAPIEIGGVALYASLSLLFAYAFIASIYAWRSATGSARDRARAFTIAFGFRDICWGFVYGAAIWLIWKDAYSIVDPDISSTPYLVYILGTLFAIPLIAYGILRTQLFDIDLRIQWTIKQSTLAGIFVTTVYLISEGADRFFASELGNYAGLLASAVVVFFLAPLQRFAERISRFAMPNTENTPEYAKFRKMQVYEAALVEASAGGISDKERSLLDHLRDSLEISEADAAAMERDQ